MKSKKLLGIFHRTHVSSKYILEKGVLFLLLISISCSNPYSPLKDDNIWISLGLSGESITKIKTTQSYIYACASYNGLFRCPISSLNDDWVFIGLKHTDLINGIDTTKGNNTPNTVGVADIVINPNNENEILAGIITLKPNVPGIYKTIDGGNKWFEADSGYGFIPYWLPDDSGRFSPWTSARILFNHTDQFDVLFAGDVWNDGIYRSTDSGLTWDAIIEPVLNSFSQVNSFSNDPLNPNIIYVGGSSSSADATVLRPAWLIKSINNIDDMWETLLPVQTNHTYFNNVVDDICKTINPPAIYLGMRGFLLASKDGGKIWTKLIIDSNHPGEIFSVEVSPKDERHLVAANGQVFFESLDAGNTWIKLVTPVNGMVRGLKWDKQTDNLYCIANDGSGIYILQNASSWKLRDLY